jgi:ubiquinone/menaquinone biosynthesis C-methylase UbiE
MQIDHCVEANSAVNTSIDLYGDFHSPKNITDWERTSSSKFSAWKRLLEHIPEGVFVDVGCGDGSITEIIIPLVGSKCVALDISAAAVREVRSRGLDGVKCDVGYALPIGDASVDHIFCSDLFEHLLDVDGFLDEIYRVLKPGGYCILSTPNLAWLPNRLLLLLGLHPFGVELSYRFDISGLFAQKRKFPAGHIHVFTLRALLTLLKLHGFRVEKTLGTSIVDQKTLRRWNFPKWLHAFLITIDRFCELLPSWSSEVVVKFRKPS